MLQGEGVETNRAVGWQVNTTLRGVFYHLLYMLDQLYSLLLRPTLQ